MTFAEERNCSDYTGISVYDPAKEATSASSAEKETAAITLGYLLHPAKEVTSASTVDGPGLLSLFLELPKLCFVHEARKATHLQNLGMTSANASCCKSAYIQVKNMGLTCALLD